MDDDDKRKAFEPRHETPEDGTKAGEVPSRGSAPGFAIDMGALRQHPGNAARLLPPHMRGWFGFENVTPETTWDELEQAARLQMPPFSAEDELALSECDATPEGHLSYQYGRSFAEMHAEETLLTDIGPDNVRINPRTRRILITDPGHAYIRPLNPVFMATHFHEFRACYSRAPWDFGAFMAGYVHCAYQELDALIPGYTDALLARLGATFIRTPRPRRTYVDLDHVLECLGKRIDSAVPGILFKDVAVKDEHIELSDLLAVLSVLAMVGARLASLVQPLRAVRTYGGPPDLDCMLQLGERTLSATLEKAGVKRHTILLALLAEKLLGAFTDAEGWSEDWTSLPKNPVQAAMRTTLEGEASADVINVVDRACDVLHAISLHLARSSLEKQSIEFGQWKWVIVQLSLTTSRANEMRLLRLSAYDAVRTSAAVGQETFLLSIFFAAMSRWNAEMIAFKRSLKDFVAGDIRCPVFSWLFSVHDGAFHMLAKLRAEAATNPVTSQFIYDQHLVACIRALLLTRSILLEAIGICADKGRGCAYIDHFHCSMTPQGLQLEDPVANWCTAALAFSAENSSIPLAQSLLWTDFFSMAEEFS